VLEPYGGYLETSLNLLAKGIAFSPAISAVHLLASNLLVNSALGRRARQSKAQRYPLGYCLVARKPAAI
jgi:hypothetical protein